MERIKIVVDTKGGDNGAGVLVEGVAEALSKHPEISFILTGDSEPLKDECSARGVPTDRIEIIEAPEEITNYDSPATAVFTKPSSSMLVGLRALAEDPAAMGMITSGNTGVALVGAMRELTDEAKTRPALAAVLPAQTGEFTCIVDTGATIDCNPPLLVHFAHIGSDFMRRMYGIESPRVGLLSNGSEPTKGNRLVKESHKLLAEDAGINFIGNVEGNSALSGSCDVLVCDGFDGNQVLKVTEGTASRIITYIMKYAHKKNSAEIKELGMHLMGLYDIGSLGGGIILGLKKPVIKIRGNAGGKAVVSTSGMLLNMAQNKSVYDGEASTIS